MEHLSPQRVSNLGKKLYEALCLSDVRPPKTDEAEPSYTRSVLAPIIRSELAKLQGLHFQFRGDGGDSLALPASALEIPFFPDLAVSSGHQHLWAAEVKLLRITGRQAAIAAAFGQASLYRSRYQHVTVVLIDTNPSSRVSQSELVRISESLGFRVVIRPAVGGLLLGQVT